MGTVILTGQEEERRSCQKGGEVDDEGYRRLCAGKTARCPLGLVAGESLMNPRRGASLAWRGWKPDCSEMRDKNR